MRSTPARKGGDDISEGEKVGEVWESEMRDEVVQLSIKASKGVRYLKSVTDTSLKGNRFLLYLPHMSHKFTTSLKSRVF